MERCKPLLLDGAVERVSDATKAIGINDRPLPRLEMLIDVLTSPMAYGTEGFSVLADVIDAPPNQLHALLAEHLAAGGRQVTLNFDTCIERSTKPRIVDVEHLHGSVDGGGFASLGVTLRNIDRRLPAAVQERVSDYLSDAELIVFMGYSGSDFFDVEPFLRDFAARTDLTGTTIIWVAHDDAMDVELVGDHDSDVHNVPAPVKRHLRYFAEAGATALLAMGHTVAVAATFAEAWQFSALAPAEPCKPRPSPARSFSERRKAAATLRLFHQTGVRDSVAQVLERNEDLRASPEYWLIVADTAWDRGEYWKARLAFMRHYGSGRDRCRYWERIGAVFWTQGRWVPAYFALKKALRRAAPGSQAETVTLETMVRLLEHMTRSPELRWFGRSRVDSYRQRLPSVDDLGHHMKARISTIASASTVERRAMHAAALRAFEESDSLHAVLAYRHGRMRSEERPIDENRLREHRRHYLEIGGTAGAVKAMTLPGAGRAFGLSEFIGGLLSIGFGWWHRVRLLALFIRDRKGTQEE